MIKQVFIICGFAQIIQSLISTIYGTTYMRYEGWIKVGENYAVTSFFIGLVLILGGIFWHFLGRVISFLAGIYFAYLSAKFFLQGFSTPITTKIASNVNENYFYSSAIASLIFCVVLFYASFAPEYANFIYCKKCKKIYNNEENLKTCKKCGGDLLAYKDQLDKKSDEN